MGRSLRLEPPAPPTARTVTVKMAALLRDLAAAGGKGLPDGRHRFGRLDSYGWAVPLERTLTGPSDFTPLHYVITDSGRRMLADWVMELENHGFALVDPPNAVRAVTP